MKGLIKKGKVGSALRRIREESIAGWAILPMRLFLGISFLAAGFDKLADPAFLNPQASAYIGRQIAGFAVGTPLEGFLMNIAVPNADLFGIMVMGGEICIGVATLLGLLTRFSAAMGLLLNLTFFLSATWDIRPFYLGADLPYTIGWLTLMLAGPGPFALDAAVRRWLQGRPPPLSEVGEQSDTVGAGTPAAMHVPLSRRAILAAGAGGLAGAVLSAVGLSWGGLHPPSAQAEGNNGEVEPTPDDRPLPPSDGGTSGGAGSEAGSSRFLIAKPDALPDGRALEFTLPSGEPAILIRDRSEYKAYVAICTHQGCLVAPAANGNLKCPCHGAEFDPKNGAKVVAGPARRPLSNIPLQIASDGSVYLGDD